MRYNISILLGLVLLIQSLLFSADLTIENIFTSDDFSVKTVSGIQWLPNRNVFSFIEKNESGEKEIWLWNAAKNVKTKLLGKNDLTILEGAKREKRFTLPTYSWLPNGKQILVPSQNDLFIIDIESRKAERLTSDDTKERDATVSPDCRKIAYVKNDNLVVLDIDSKIETQLTTEGKKNILVGQFDWVYEEEFSIRTGFAWSPDSKKIAYYRIDQTNVPEYHMANLVPIYSELVTMKYPKAGAPNSLVRIGIVDVETKNTIWVDKKAGPDSYIPRIKWTRSSNKLALTFLNRDQNNLQILFADSQTGGTQKVLEESVENGWLKPRRDIFFSKDKDEFVWLSERDGFNHLYRYDYNGKLKKQLTKGRWDVRKLIRLTDKKVFYSASKKLEESHFYSTGLNGKGQNQITNLPGTHSINMAQTGDFYIDSFSNWETPTIQSLHKNTGKTVEQLNEPTVPALDQHGLASIEFMKFPTSNGYKLPAYLIKPADFDPTKKYAVLIYTYAGPGSHSVANRWGGTRAFWYTLLTQKGYLVCAINGRGTSYQGREWKHLLYKKLGQFEIEDQIEGAKYLQTLPYVDKNRIGIWGWSYGGYTSIMALLKGADIFKMGIAVAPVTDWRNYDTIYTERFMGRPQENEEAYNKGAATTFAKNLRGNLLLIHGCADDNVHMSNTMQLAREFQRHSKQFDMMVYPQKLHGIGGTNERVHLYTKMTDYILNNL